MSVLSTVLDQTLAAIAFRKQTESLQNRQTDKTGSGNGGGYASHDWERWERVMIFDKGTKRTGPLNQTKRLAKKETSVSLGRGEFNWIIFPRGSSGLWLTYSTAKANLGKLTLMLSKLFAKTASEFAIPAELPFDEIFMSGMFAW